MLPQGSWINVENPTDQDMAVIYSGARALVFPSLGEGFGLPVLEAMRCGCPPIVASTSSLPEVAGQAALYIDPLKPQSISDAALALTQSTSLYEALSKTALERSAQFTWKRCALETAEVLRRAARRYALSAPAKDVNELLGSESGSEIQADEGGFELWDTKGVTVRKSDRLFNVGVDQFRTVIVREEPLEGLHAVEGTLRTGYNELHMVLILRRMQRDHAAVWVRFDPASRSDDSQARVYIDLQNRVVTEMFVTGDVLVRLCEVDDAGDGWCRLRLRVRPTSQLGPDVKVVVAARRGPQGSAIYEGSGIDAFELLHYRAWLHSADLASDETEIRTGLNH
jgi:hypothetical protein